MITLRILAAKAELRRARIALDVSGRIEEAAGIDHETPVFRALNRAVADAERAVPWWLDSPSEIWGRWLFRHHED